MFLYCETGQKCGKGSAAGLIFRNWHLTKWHLKKYTWWLKRLKAFFPLGLFVVPKLLMKMKMKLNEIKILQWSRACIRYIVIQALLFLAQVCYSIYYNIFL